MEMSKDLKAMEPAIRLAQAAETRKRELQEANANKHGISFDEMMTEEDAAKLKADMALLDALPFGEFVEASGKVFIISARKGKRWLVPVPKLLSFKRRQKFKQQARAAARANGLLK